MLEGHLGRLAGVFQVRLVRVGCFLGRGLRAVIGPWLPATWGAASAGFIPLGFATTNLVAGPLRFSGFGAGFFARLAPRLFALAGKFFAAGLGFFTRSPLRSAGLFVVARNVPGLATFPLFLGTGSPVIADAVAARAFVAGLIG